VLLAVFVPITFLEGDVGRLFSEFAVTISAAVCFSSFASLSLSPMVASKVLTAGQGRSRFHSWVDRRFEALTRFYERTLRSALGAPWVTAALFIAVGAAAVWLFGNTPSEYVPREDRGAFFILVNAPEGSSFAYTEEHMNEI
jgi:multidrug efflux pump